MKNFILVSTLLLFGVSNKIHAQFNISYPTPAESLTVCNQSSKLTVRIIVGATTTSNNKVTITLPTGIAYVPDSVIQISGNLSITQSNSNTTAPVFDITPATANVGQEITFTIDRTANCDALSTINANGIFKDIVSVTGTEGTTIDNNPAQNSYIVRVPLLTFFQPAQVNNTSVGQSYTRSFQLTNGSVGCARDIHFSITYPASDLQLNSLTVDGNLIAPTSTSGSTKYFSILNRNLCNGETLNFIENFKVLACNAQTNYAVGWGCNSAPASWCATKTGTGVIAMSSGAPNFSNYTFLRSNFVDACTPFTLTSTYTNGATAAIASAMYDVKFRLGGVNLTDANMLGNFGFNVLNLLSVTVGNSTVSVSGGTSVGIASIDLNNVFTTDPDGIGGLDDIDNDGFFDDLPGASTATIVINTKANCNAFVCNVTYDYLGIYGDIQYRTMCGANVTSTVRKTGSNIQHRSFINTNLSSAPANVFNNIPFSARFSVGTGLWINYFDNSKTRFLYEITLPLGLSVAGTGNIVWRTGNYPANYGTAGISVPYTQVGNKITITSPTPTSGNGTIGYFDINFVYDCTIGPGGNDIDIPFTFKRIDNIQTGCITCNSEIFCSKLVLSNVVCPTVCLAGLSTSFVSVERADNSLGWTNNTLVTRQLRSAISAFNLAKALYLDTIEVKTNATQIGSASNAYLKFNIKKVNSQNGDILTPVSLEVVVKRTATTVSSGTVLSPTQVQSTTNQVFAWDLTTVLPSGGLLDGDVVETKAVYKVISSNLPGTDSQTGVEAYLYNLDGTSEVFCSKLVPELYLVVPIILDTNIATLTGTGCADYVIANQNNYGYRLSNNGAKYVNEFRPGFLPKKYHLTVPSNYELVSVTNSNGYTMPAPTITGSTFSYDLPVRIYEIETTQAAITFSVTLRPKCSASSITQTLVSKLDYVPYYYYNVDANNTPVPNPALSVVTRNRLISTSQKATITLTNQTGNITAVLATESFVVRVASTGTITAPFVWISIPTVAGINIAQVVDVANNTVQTPISYSNGLWYKLSTTGLPSGSNVDYRISFTYNSCNQKTIVVNGNWDCYAYPTSPDDFACRAANASTSMTLTQNVSALEISPVSEPASNIMLCTSIPFEYRVNSYQVGGSFENKFFITTPSGANIVSGTAQIEYPINSSNWQNSTYITNGNQTTINLNQHLAYPTTGLPGVLISPAANPRGIGIRFNLTTNCDFESGSVLKLSTMGTNGCGSTSIGSNIDVNSKTLFIAGAQPSHSITSAIAVQANNCTTNLQRIDFSSTIIGNTSEPQEYFKITLPAGVTYVVNSATSTANMVPAFNSATTLGNGKQEVRFNLPSGLTSGQNILFSIIVNTANYTYSTTNKLVNLQTLYTLTAISCGAQSCPNGTVITGFADAFIKSRNIWLGNNSTWDLDSNWSNGTKPTLNDCVEVAVTANDPVILTTNYNATAGTLTLTNSTALNINANCNLTVTDWINIAPTANFVLENNSNLVQINAVTNTGDILYKRSALVKKLDYVYWSSPVVGKSVTTIYPGTPIANTLSWAPTALNNNGSTGNWQESSGLMPATSGYAIRVPNTLDPITATTLTTTFVGIPHNGNYTTAVSRGSYDGVDITAPNGATVTRNDDNWNLIGNPYPSAIDAEAFLVANTSVQGSIDIWTHGTVPSNSQAQPFYGTFGNNYNANDYVTYNSLGSGFGPNSFAGKIAAGQAFFVKMIDGGTAATGSVSFTNALRSASFDNRQFYRVVNTAEKHRIWLDLVDNSSDLSSRILVGYCSGATQEYDRLFDATADYQGSQSFHSLIGQEIYSIQGRALPFSNTDTVSLGIAVPSAGTYKIGIHTVDGLFANNGQTIYLQDNQVSLVHNLSVSPYTFVSAAGGNKTRFVLRYTAETLGNTNQDLISTSILVWKATDFIKLQSTENNILSVTIFDILGRNVFTQNNLNTKNFEIANVVSQQQTLLVKITLDNGMIITKKIVY